MTLLVKRLVACTGDISALFKYNLRSLGLLQPTIMGNVFPASELSRCSAFNV